MDKKEKTTMNESTIGSTFEISLRILLMLDCLSPLQLDAQQIGMIDFISVYAADFGLLDENLHGYSNYRFSEFPARKQPIEAALRYLILDGYVHLTSTSNGYEYSITTAGKTVSKQLHSSYSEEYCLAVKTVVSAFNPADTAAMLNAINSLTVKSLKEVTHK